MLVLLVRWRYEGGEESRGGKVDVFNGKDADVLDCTVHYLYLS
jgi:hypothetical protein